MDRQPRDTSAYRAAGRALALQHRRLGARGARGPRREGAVRGGAAKPDLRAARDARHGVLDIAARSAGHGLSAHARGSGGVWDEPDGRWSRAPDFGDGAGGLVSTVDDLHSFARMFLRDGAPVLSPDAVRAMTSDQLTGAQRARGGLGPGFFA